MRDRNSRAPGKPQERKTESPKGRAAAGRSRQREVRGLERRKSVLIIADERDPDFARGVQQYALLHPDLCLHVHLMEFVRRIELRQIEEIIRRLDPVGVIAPATPQTKRVLERMKIPVVNSIDEVATKVPTVMFDQAAAGRMAAEHLIGQGLERFGYVSRTRGLYAELRWRGYHGALKAAGFGCELFDDVFHVPQTEGIADALVRQWLADLPRPIGIHTAHTALGARVITACQDLGLRVPQDVAVIGGMDRPYFCTMWEPGLSAFSMSRRRWGYESLKLLDALLRGAPKPAGPVLIAPEELVQRESTERQGSADPVVAAALRLIRDNGARPVAIKQLLTEIRVSRRAMEIRFKHAMGRTLHDEIVRVHMERAKTLLSDSLLPVRVVAVQSGFSSAQNCAASFRKHTGLTPGQFREKMAKLG